MARRIAVEIVGDASSLERSFQRATKDTQKFNRDISQAGRGTVAASGAFRSMGRSVAFASGSFIGAAGLTAAVKSSIQAASDLNEQMSKTNAVFGDSAAGIEAWAETTAGALGISQRQALATASSFGALFKPIGLLGPEAARQSQALTQLGADLASFYNTDVQSALDAIRSGLVGESEPLRQYGVLLSETRVQQQALADTGKKHATQLTNQEKALARIKIIFQDTNIAQGDFNRTSGGLAGQTKILQANIDDLSVALGENLVPALTLAVQGINNLIDAMKRVPDPKKSLGRFGFLADLAELEVAPGQFVLEAIARRRKKQQQQQPGSVWDRARAAAGIGTVWDRARAALVPPTPVAEVKRTAEQRNAWFDAMIGRREFRAGLLPLRQQLAALTKVSALLTQRIAITKDITRKLNLKDQLLQVNADRAALRAQLHQQLVEQAAAATQAARDEALAWADFAVEKAAATKGLKDDLKAAQDRLKLLEKQAGVGKKTAEEARAIWEQQQEINRIRKEMGRAEKGFATQFKPMNVSGFIQSLGLDLTVQQMRRLAVGLAQLGPGGTLPAKRSAAFAGAGGVYVAGDVHVNGVQNTKQLEAELHKRAHRRAKQRRGN